MYYIKKYFFLKKNEYILKIYNFSKTMTLCNFCQKGAYFKCSWCESKFYCGIKCQKHDWKEEHFLECAKDTKLKIDNFLQNYIPIISPVHGTISFVSSDSRSESASAQSAKSRVMPVEGNLQITIYISPKDNHTIYAPKTGKITNITHFNGKWIRKVFQADVEKIARVTIEMDPIDFWIEVGKPLYLTDRIRVEKNIGDNVTKGEQLGEIILGSLAELHVKKGTFFILSPEIKEGKKVIGGQSILCWIPG